MAVRSVVASIEALGLADRLRLPINLVISNIPGPRRAVFIHGARMLTHYPVSAPVHGCALNITVQSYQDRMDFSLTACRGALPDGHKLRDDMLSAWEELKALAPTAVGARKSESEGLSRRTAA
jgi:hypothetical protein